MLCSVLEIVDVKLSICSLELATCERLLPCMSEPAYAWGLVSWPFAGMAGLVGMVDEGVDGPLVAVFRKVFGCLDLILAFPPEAGILSLLYNACYILGRWAELPYV